MQTIIPALLLALPIFSASAQSIWVEGEDATSKSVQHNGWYEGLKTEELSGGGYIAHWGNQPGTASYQVGVPKSGSYVLWLRANGVGSSLNVNFGGGEWFNVDFKRDSRENINLATDNKPDLRFVSWVRAGASKLAAGEHEIGVRFNSGNNHHGILDCFCLTTDSDWKPSRTLKPGESKPHFAEPEITGANLDQWLAFIRPAEEELGWRKVRWHNSLSRAAAEAARLQRPILLWAMNGHPCGET